MDQESKERKSQRLQLLKQRAQAVLDQCQKSGTMDRPDAMGTSKLLEDLRIYQVELELQNEELRAAQLEAEHAQRSYRTLFDQMPLPALVLDTNGIVDDCNERATTLLGAHGRFVALDIRFWHRLNKPDRARLHVALRDVMPGQSQVLRRVEITNQAGAPVVFDVHLIGLSMDYKLDRRVLLLLVDRNAEQAREQERRLYDALLDATDNPIYAADLEGKMLLVNQALLQLLQRPRDAVLGHTRESFQPLRDALLHREADQQVLQSGVPTTFEERIHPVGESDPIDFVTRRFPLYDRAGKAYGVGGIATDVSALKAQQRKLLLSESVFQNSDQAIIVTDAQMHIIRVNAAFTRMTGFSAEAVLGQHTRVLKSGRHSPAFYESIGRSLMQTGHWAGELNNRRADGSFFTVWSNISVVRDSEGQVMHYIALQSDVTQLHEAQIALQRQASYDGLTGLPNRDLFNDRIAQLVAQSQRQQSQFALLFVDLDHFKEVNDTLGHQVGDILLRTVSERLQRGVRSEDTVARMGGDEFVILLPNTDRPGALSLANNLLVRLREPLVLEGAGSYRPMASMGVSVFPEDGRSPDELLRSADMAMYRAKMTGRNRMLSYTADMGASNDLAFTIQTELAIGLVEQQFRVYYQPKCMLNTGELVGAEALVRWDRPGHGITLPGVFIGVAEKSGLLVELDHWVMQDSLRQLGEWLRAGLWKPTMRMAVNQNVADLQRSDLLDQINALLQASGVGPEMLELEITEDALLHHTSEQLERLQALRSTGVSVAIDDFGTGYSSLSYLRLLPVSVIKIDQSFVASMLTDANDAVLVRTIIDMAHDLGHSLVAEGVETPMQCERLCELGAEVGQGYFFGYPVSAEEFEQRWLRNFAS
ncbi:sensor domain-containing protein [Candidatus Symbiobacter mobilis]|uniref:Signal transduction protein n=1 Tax=Candidatus Symbiobacter mobilis CR TaxID=946483 RepID=U5N8V2_9BURK|nr:EAL domain-containing protein [Candidatus Symbiobacter mobilis]AGX87966.1 signal transduction protein [Candidatus Symbiobacter mobilis CR]